MRRGECKRLAVAVNPAAWHGPWPGRRVLLQLWLVERAWGRIILHTWCLVFHHGKWFMARSGIARGLRDLARRMPSRFRNKKQRKP